MYRIMPLKAISRAWGKFNQLELPVVLRRPLLGLYVWMFDCKVDEAMETELQNYKNLGEFFRRVLKPDIRLISQKEELVRRRKTFKMKKKCLRFTWCYIMRVLYQSRFCDIILVLGKLYFLIHMYFLASRQTLQTARSFILVKWQTVFWNRLKASITRLSIFWVPKHGIQSLRSPSVSPNRQMRSTFVD